MAAERNITIVQGDTYVHEIRLRSNANAVINVSSSTFSGQIRKSGVSDVVIASFSINTSNSSNGNIIFTLSSGITGNIKKGVYFYDFQEVTNGVTVTLLAGRANVSKDITNAG
jgi:hypothetical protein